MDFTEVSYQSFADLEIRVGKVVEAKKFERARQPAYQVVVDFGMEVGKLNSSAQITDQYSAKDLVGKTVIGIVNFPSKQIANFMSDCLILGVYGEEGVVLLTTDKPCKPGQKIG